MAVDDNDLQEGLDNNLETGAEDGGEGGEELSTEEQLAALRQELANEKQTRETAEKERDAERASRRSADDGVTIERTGRLNAEADRAKVSHENKTQELNGLKQELQQAHESGDYALVAELTAKMNDVQFELKQIAHWQGQVEQAKKLTPDDWKKIETKTPPPAKPEISKETQAWIDAHPRFNSDEEYFGATMAAHNIAIKQGIKTDTPAYFKFVNERLEKQFPDDGQRADPPARRDVPRSSQSAPPARGANVGAGAGPGYSAKSVRLTPEQREAAAFSGMTDAEYAKSLDVLNTKRNSK